MPASSFCMFDLGQAPKAAALQPEPVTRPECQSADTEHLRLLSVCACAGHIRSMCPALSLADPSDLTLSIRHCNCSNSFSTLVQRLHVRISSLIGGLMTVLSLTEMQVNEP
jgi:hypothetical protein